MNKKTIAKHTLGLIGVVALWFILDEVLNDNYTLMDKNRPQGRFLLLGLLVGYIVVYWAVKTIWFDKDKD